MMLGFFIKDTLKIVRRYWAIITANTIGLAVALATFMLIMMQRHYEMHAFSSYADSERIFRMDVPDVDPPFNLLHPYAVVNDLRHLSDDIESVSGIYKDEKSYCIYADSLSSIETLACVDMEYFDIFNITPMAGSLETMRAHDTCIVISENTAIKMFGTRECIGRTVKTNLVLNPHQDFTVAAVYQSRQDITSMRDAMLIKIQDDTTNYERSNYVTFIRLRTPSRKQAAEDAIMEYISQNQGTKFSYLHKVELVNIADIYYRNDSPDGTIFEGGSKMVSNSLLIIDILMLVASTINYVNFNLSLIPMEIKCINIHKILGASMWVLRGGTILQCSLGCVAAYGISLIAIHIMEGSRLLSFLSAPTIGLSQNIGICLWTGLIAIAIGVISSVYPTYKQTAMPASVAVKGREGFSSERKRLVVLLIIVQFTFSLIFVTSAVFVMMQNLSMKSTGIGAKSGNIAVSMVDRQLCQSHYREFVDKCKICPGIRNVAFSMQLIGGSDNYNTGVMNSGRDTICSMHVILCTPEILDVFGLRILRGRNFCHDSINQYCGVVTQYTDSIAHKVLNEYERGQYEKDVAGVTENISITSKRKSDQCIAFITNRFAMSVMNYVYVRLNDDADIPMCLAHIQRVAQEINPAYHLQPVFYNDIMDDLYRPETSLQLALLYLSIITILIAISGLVIMLAMEASHRRKEMAIRRVFGATIMDLLASSNLRFLKLLAISFLISVPVVHVFITQWQNMFTEQICLSWWVFVSIFAGIVLLIAVVISAMVLFSARRNVADSIRE